MVELYDVGNWLQRKQKLQPIRILMALLIFGASSAYGYLVGTSNDSSHLVLKG